MLKPIPIGFTDLPYLAPGIAFVSFFIPQVFSRSIHGKIGVYFWQNGVMQPYTLWPTGHCFVG